MVVLASTSSWICFLGAVIVSYGPAPEELLGRPVEDRHKESYAWPLLG